MLKLEDFHLDFDTMFERNIKALDFEQCGKAAGLQPREKQSIMDPWPLRFNPEAEDEETKRRFKLLLVSPHTGFERYVEWVRAAPASG